MPLSSNTQETIFAGINHLLEFSSADEINRLRTILIADEKDVDKADEYYGLRESLYHPTRQFIQLETSQAEAFSVSEVQQYILNLINNAVEKAKQQGVQLQQGWNSQAILARVTADKKYSASSFKSEERPVFNGAPSWELPPTDGLIYKHRFSLSHTEAKVHIEVDLGTKKLIKKTTSLGRVPFFEYDDQQDSWVEKKKDEAIRKARFEAATIAIRYLKKQGVAFKPYMLLSLQMVATHKLGFSLLKERKLTVSQLEDAIIPEIIIHPFVAGAIERGILNPESALKIDMPAARVVCHPFYGRELVEGRLKPDELNHINDTQSRFLILPVVVNLVASKRLTILQARTLSELEELFISPLYSEYLLREQIDWKSFSSYTETEEQLLLNKHFANLVKKGIFNISAINTLTCRIRHVLYFNQKWLEELDKKTDAPANIPVMLGVEIYLFTQRLFGMYKNSPCRLSFTEHDSMASIAADMLVVELEFRGVNLCEIVIRELLPLIRSDLKLKLKNTDPLSRYIPYYQSLNNYLDQFINPVQSWIEIFIGFLRLVQQKPQAESFFSYSGIYNFVTDLPFFSHKHQRQAEELSVDSHIATLRGLGNMVEVRAHKKRRV